MELIKREKRVNQVGTRLTPKQFSTLKKVAKKVDMRPSSLMAIIVGDWAFEVDNPPKKK